MTHQTMIGIKLAGTVLAAATGWAAAAEPWQATDLNPVTIQPAVRHAPVELVVDRQPRAVVHLADPNPSANLKILVDELVEVVRLTSGATLEVVKEPPAADRPTLVIGDGEESRRAGIDAAQIPSEGFVVKTGPNRVFLVGSTQALPVMEIAPLAGNPYANDGTAWAVADFLERFVGVRWYWPLAAGGRSLTTQATLTVPSVHYADQPVFRKREFYPWYGYPKGAWRSIWWDKAAPTLPESLLPPGTEKIDMQPLLAGLRMGNSWPYVIKVHEPQHFMRQWEKYSKIPDMFQRGADGAANLNMLCYSSPKTLAYLLQGCEDAWEHGKPASWVTSTCVTVSPGDYPVRCHCEGCAPLFEPDRAPYGTSSKLMGLFVKRVCEAVKARWPDKKVLYLPYWNYTECQEDLDFPDNLEVQMCTMAFGLLRQLEPRARMEKHLRAWSKKVGGPVTTWEYSHRLHEWTYAPVQYPHLVQDYYRANRDILAGSFLNGGQIGEWSTGAPGNYVWMKILWNPDVEVDAILDELCRRQFGQAGDTCREMLALMAERWEKAPWREGLGDAGRVTPPVFADTWPPETVAKLVELRERARRELAGDAEAEQRFAYWTWTFDYFLDEAKAAWAAAPAAPPAPPPTEVQNRFP